MTARRLRSALWRGIVTGTAALAVVLTVALIVGVSLGFRPVIVLTGSMGGSMPAGSLAIAGPSSDVVVGDVVVMRGEGRPTVTHRVVGLAAGVDGDIVATTRGDANPDVDPTTYTLDDRQMTVRYVIPGLGRLLLSLRSPLVGGALIVIVVLGFLRVALRSIWRSSPSRTATTGSVPATSGASTSPVPPPPPPTPTRQGVGRRDGIAATITAITAITVIGVATLAVYSATASADDIEFTTRECFGSRLQGVQQGTATSSTTGVSSIAIAPVDPSRSFVLFSSSSADGEPDESVASLRLADSSTLEVVRASDSAPSGTVQIEWSVVEYACGVSVQRGTINGAGATALDVTLAPIDPTSSFAVVSSLPGAGSVDYGSDVLTSAHVLDAGTLRIDAAVPIPASTRLDWQVVTFDTPGEAVVQTLTATLIDGVSTTTVAIPASVNPSSTLLVAGIRTANSGATIGDRLVRVRLLDEQTIEVERDLTTGSADVDVQVVELRDGSTVQRGVLDFAIGQGTATATMPPVSVGRTTAVSTVTFAGGSSGGSTSMAIDDVVGEGSVRARLLDSQTVELRRDATAASASFAWQAVTWGGPVWADLESPFRRRIDVAGGSVATPDGYTTSLVFDHAEMVVSGQSLANGDDIRIWRHDGVSWTELDRVLDQTSAWNATDTQLWFRTREPIAAGQTVNYWMYFGDDTPAAVLDDEANVWLVTETFDGGDLGIFDDRTSGTGWYRADPWTQRFALTIPAGRTAVDLFDEPVLVRFTSAALAAAAQPDGSDLRFVADDGVTRLAHEIESYDAVTGAVTAWVKVPVVATAAPTPIWLYAGAPNSPDQGAATAVWNAEFAVWNLAADPTGPAPALDDSGPRRLDGVALADAALGADPTGPAIVLDGALDRLESAPFVADRNALTVTAWFRVDDTRDQVLVTHGDPLAGGSFELSADPSAALDVRARLRLGAQLVEVSGGVVTVGAWHHVAMTWDGVTARLYLDGVDIGDAAAAGELVVDGPLAAAIGAAPDGSRAVAGALGQVRLDDQAWSPARVGFAAGNLLDPSATVTLGPPEAGTWFDQGDWTLRRPLAVESDLVAGPLTDYPLLVQLVDPDLTAALQPSADDLVVTDADGITRLDHHLESWDAGTGALTLWVRVPMLDDVDDSLLYLYLSNPTADDQQDPLGVWGPDADLVLLE